MKKELLIKKNINIKDLVSQPFHLVTLRPWPIIISILVLVLIIRFIRFFHKFSVIVMVMFLLIRRFCLIQWMRDVVRESYLQGFHCDKVIVGIKLGILLFIISEVIFFFRFFWSYFHFMLSPRIELGGLWPPYGVVLFNPFIIPLLNTVILLSSGVTITICHYYILKNKLNLRILFLILTILLGLVFTIIQLYEYQEAFYSISDSVFGSIFFLRTGFHGLHVLIGTTMLISGLLRLVKINYSINHHVGFELFAWYWHFVDVVWLFLYLLIYYWIY